jgi:hypothetical protein
MGIGSQILIFKRYPVDYTALVARDRDVKNVLPVSRNSHIGK